MSSTGNPLIVFMKDGSFITAHDSDDECADDMRAYQDALRTWQDAVSTQSAAIREHQQAVDRQWSPATATAELIGCYMHHPSKGGMAECDRQVNSTVNEQQDDVDRAWGYVEKATAAAKHAEEEKNAARDAWEACQQDKKHSEAGCGSRGGPGYMTSRGKCASWSDVA
ncbi:hypothetical protein [Curtobacterium pusillum]|uniref:hypothetical protein n=1 Tax=Curtobacterium pusillum TaxID=69373 RepID=UPI00119DB29A|nr:hypothetical protein [Curtobacterium pusillum]